MSVYVYTTVKDYKATKKVLKQMQKAPAKVVKQSLSDAHKKAPGWIASEVAHIYGVSRTEIESGKVGRTRVKGDSIDNIQVKYTGHSLSVRHFKVTPKAEKLKAGSRYTMKAAIIKGNQVTLGKVKKLTKKQKANIGRNFRRQGVKQSDHSPIMWMHTGAKSADKVQSIPFQRKSQERTDLKAIKTVSLPQMVGGWRTEPNITATIQEKLGECVERRTKQLWK